MESRGPRLISNWSPLPQGMETCLRTPKNWIRWRLHGQSFSSIIGGVISQVRVAVQHEGLPVQFEAIQGCTNQVKSFTDKDVLENAKCKDCSPACDEKFSKLSKWYKGWKKCVLAWPRFHRMLSGGLYWQDRGSRVSPGLTQHPLPTYWCIYAAVRVGLRHSGRRECGKVG